MIYKMEPAFGRQNFLDTHTAQSAVILFIPLILSKFPSFVTVPCDPRLNLMFFMAISKKIVIVSIFQKGMLPK